MFLKSKHFLHSWGCFVKNIVAAPWHFPKKIVAAHDISQDVFPFIEVYRENWLSLHALFFKGKPLFDSWGYFILNNRLKTLRLVYKTWAATAYVRRRRGCIKTVSKVYFQTTMTRVRICGKSLNSIVSFVLVNKWGAHSKVAFSHTFYKNSMDAKYSIVFYNMGTKY